MIVVTVDVGGSKTAVAVSDSGQRLLTLAGPGAAVRPGRTMTSASAIADLARKALAQTGRLRADGLVVGAAGAGRSADAEEVRAVLVRERIAERVVVVSDVALALEALGSPTGVVLIAGTGSIAIGRTAAGLVRQGGYGWQMGDEGGGYWIGTQALRAAGLAHDGRGPDTRLETALRQATGAREFRDLVAWSTVAGPREVAALARTVMDTAEQGDAESGLILDQAAGWLAGMLAVVARSFDRTPIPLGLTGGLLSEGSRMLPRLRAVLDPRFANPVNVDPLLGGEALLRQGGPDQDGDRKLIRL